MCPVGEETLWAALWHLDAGEGLATGNERFFISLAAHGEADPEAGTLEFFQGAVNDQFVAEFSGEAVVDLCADDHREKLGFCHGGEVHTHVGSEMGSAGFDHPKVSDVVDDTTAVGIKEHYFLVGGHFGHGHGRESPESRA